MYEELLHYAVDYALSLGAKYAEARYQVDELLTIVVREGNVVALGKSLTEGVGIRVLYGGVLTFSATNDLSRDGMVEVVKSAVNRAKALSHLMRRSVEFSEERLGKASYEVKPVKKFDSLPIDWKIGFLEELHKIAVGSVKEVKVPVTLCEYVEHVQRKAVVNSDGAFVEGIVPRLSITFNIVAAHPQRGTVQRLLGWGASGGLELIDEWRPLQHVEEEVKAMERILMFGREPPKEAVDVVVGSEVVGLIVHESAGHPMEADRILGREAAQAGESFIKPEFIGKERVGNEYATVIEDPTIPRSFGYYLYDDEGVRARPRYLYKEGLINEPLHNRYTAKVFNTVSNGAARAMSYANEPIVRMSNTYLKPGDMSFEELIEDIKLGVYIKSYMEWNIDDMRWNQRYVGLESYLIVNGELKDLLRNPVLEITTKSFYSKISGVDKNLRFYPGTCGKGEPAQGVPVWFGGPNVRLSSIRLGVVV